MLCPEDISLFQSLVENWVLMKELQVGIEWIMVSLLGLNTIMITMCPEDTLSENSDIEQKKRHQANV